MSVLAAWESEFRESRSARRKTTLSRLSQQVVQARRQFFRLPAPAAVASLRTEMPTLGLLVTHNLVRKRFRSGPRAPCLAAPGGPQLQSPWAAWVPGPGQRSAEGCLRLTPLACPRSPTDHRTVGPRYAPDRPRTFNT